MRSAEPVTKMADGDLQGGNAGLAALIEAERGSLLRFLAARCGDPSEAEDLLQELWLKAATIPTGPIANGRAYLFRMANNLVLDRERGRRRAMRRDRAWLDADEPAAVDIEARRDLSPNAETELIEAQEAEQVRRAVAALPDGARRALVLYRFEGLGQGEIARIMGISRSGVEKHLSLAMKHLRRSLSDCGFFDAASSQEQETAGGTAPNRSSMP
jgi:RNA polymerase sigma-70 factor (ECF subfamily)